MPATKLTAKRINTFLQHLGSLVNSLPTREQKDEIERELDTVISFLTDFKARLTGLPTREDEASLEQSLKVLRHFVAVAEADPLISRTLGLNTKPSRTRSGTARPRTSPDISAMVDQLKASSPEEIREALSPEGERLHRRRPQADRRLHGRPSAKQDAPFGDRRSDRQAGRERGRLRLPARARVGP